MKRKKFSFLAVVKTSVLFLLLTSCCNDLFTEFDFEMDNQNGMMPLSEEKTVSHEIKILSSLSKNNPELYADILSDGIKKIGISFTKESGYTFKCKNGKEAGISEELYEYITKRFKHTSFLINQTSIVSSKKVNRTKRNNPEGTIRPNCFPIALSHYGSNPPSYSDICSYLNQLQPGWESIGVWNDYQMGVFVHFNLNVNGRGYLTHSTNMGNAVVRIVGSVIFIPSVGNMRRDHTVNGLTYVCGSEEGYNDDYIDYYDYQMNCPGTVGVSEIEEIFIESQYLR